jgi:hypothetical protein
VGRYGNITEINLFNVYAHAWNYHNEISSY